MSSVAAPSLSRRDLDVFASVAKVDPDEIIKQVVDRDLIGHSSIIRDTVLKCQVNEVLSRNNLRTASNIRRIKINNVLDADLQQSICSVYPEFEFDFVQNRSTPHAYSRVCRMVDHHLFESFYHKPGKLVNYHHEAIDVGGNYMYHIKQQDGVHSCVPTYLDIRDGQRKTNRSYELHRYAAKTNQHSSVFNRYFCDNKAQHCAKTAPVLLFHHSIYDISNANIADIFQIKNALVGYATIIFTPDILLRDSSRCQPMDFVYTIKEVNKIKTINFDFHMDSSFGYSHRLDNYLDKLKSVFVSTDGTVRVVAERMIRANNTMYIYFTRVTTPFQSSSLSYNVWHSALNDKCIAHCYDWDNSISSTRPVHHMVYRPVLCSTSLYEAIFQFAMGLQTGSFTMESIRTAAGSYNLRYVVNGVQVHNVSRLCYRDLELIVSNIYILAYNCKYNTTKVNQEQVRDVVAVRNTAMAGFWKTFFTKVKIGYQNIKYVFSGGMRPNATKHQYLFGSADNEQFITRLTDIVDENTSREDLQLLLQPGTLSLRGDQYYFEAIESDVANKANFERPIMRHHVCSLKLVPFVRENVADCLYTSVLYLLDLGLTVIQFKDQLLNHPIINVPSSVKKVREMLSNNCFADTDVLHHICNVYKVQFCLHTISDVTTHQIFGETGALYHLQLENEHFSPLFEVTVDPIIKTIIRPSSLPLCTNLPLCKYPSNMYILPPSELGYSSISSVEIQEILKSTGFFGEKIILYNRKSDGIANYLNTVRCKLYADPSYPSRFALKLPELNRYSQEKIENRLKIVSIADLIIFDKFDEDKFFDSFIHANNKTKYIFRSNIRMLSDELQLLLFHFHHVEIHRSQYSAYQQDAIYILCHGLHAQRIPPVIPLCNYLSSAYQDWRDRIDYVNTHGIQSLGGDDLKYAKLHFTSSSLSGGSKSAFIQFLRSTFSPTPEAYLNIIEMNGLNSRIRTTPTYVRVYPLAKYDVIDTRTPIDLPTELNDSISIHSSVSCVDASARNSNVEPDVELPSATEAEQPQKSKRASRTSSVSSHSSFKTATKTPFTPVDVIQVPAVPLDLPSYSFKPFYNYCFNSKKSVQLPNFINALRELIEYHRIVKFSIAEDLKTVLLSVNCATNIVGEGDTKKNYTSALLLHPDKYPDVRILYNDEVIHDATNISSFDYKYVLNDDKRSGSFIPYSQKTTGLSVCSAATETHLDDNIYAATKSLLLVNDYDFKVSVKNGVPGCGKSTYILNAHEKFKDLVLFPTKASREDFVRRVKTKYAPFKFDESLYRRCYRTIYSFVLNHNGDKFNRIFIDEARMSHPGTIPMVAILARAKEVVLLGDKLQIPYINRMPTAVLIYQSLESIFAFEPEHLSVSYRCPHDIADYFRSDYAAIGGDFKSKTTVYKSIQRSVVIANVNAMEHVQNHDVYLTLKQAEKQALQKILPNKLVHTVHEYQGQQAESVAFVRLSHLLSETIYQSKSHRLVAMTRHTKSFTYYSVTKDCPLFKNLDSITPLVGGSFLLGPRDVQTSGNVINFTRKELMSDDNIPHILHKLNSVTNPLVSYERINSYGRISWFLHHFKHTGFGFTQDVFTPKQRKLLDDYKAVVPVVPSTVHRYDNVETPLPKVPPHITLSGNYNSVVFLQTAHDMQFYHHHLQEPIDMYQLENNDISFNLENCVVSLAKKPIKKSEFSCLMPVLRTINPLLGNTSQNSLLKSLEKRNFAVPKLSTNVIPAKVVGEFMFTNFLDTYFTCLQPFDKISYNERLIREWLTTQQSDAMIKETDVVPLFMKRVNAYNVSVKRTAKPVLTDTAVLSIPPLQTIMYQGAYFNLLFCPIMRELRDRFLSILCPRFIIYTGMTLEQLQSKMDYYFSRLIDTYALEVDMSKYDKSQGEICLEFELRLFAFLGLDSDLCDLWRDMHETSSIYDPQNKVKARLNYQRKSGDAATFFGNTTVLMAIMAVLYDMKDCALGLFAGDDSLLFFNTPVVDKSHICSTLFNIESKLLSYHSTYFCSKFIIITDAGCFVVPDPAKLLVKLGRSDIRNFKHLSEYVTSLRDLTKCYANPMIDNALNFFVHDRYPNLPQNVHKYLYSVIHSDTIFEMFVQKPGTKLYPVTDVSPKFD